LSISEYLLVLRRRWRIWLTGLVLGVLAAVLVNTASPKSYTATATSFVTIAIPDEGDQSGIFQGSQFTVQRVKSYASLIRSPLVLEPVLQQVPAELTVPGLRAKASASSPLETSLIQVSVVDRDPELAADLANAISQQLALVVKKLETPEGSDKSQVRMDLTNPAETPEAPSFPRTKLNLLLGAFVGLALGLVAAVIRNQLDRRVKTRDDVRAITGTSPLGVSLRDSAVRRNPILVRERSPAGVEAMRTIRTGLRFATVDSELHHFALTSSVGGEGKSVLACNLAMSWAVSGASVCLVEADLRRPEVAHYLGLEGAVGLSDMLLGEARLDEVLIPWNHGLLTVLPAGSLPPDPTALLESEAMRSLVSELAARFDIVIYDTPPVLAVADALVLGRELDGVVLLVRSGRTTREQLHNALDTLSKASARVLGTVLTFVHGSTAQTYESSRRVKEVAASPLDDGLPEIQPLGTNESAAK
jgi:succinoglycan biosynthesis transport protein ExoP